jgi:hypothetical protein
MTKAEDRAAYETWPLVSLKAEANRLGLPVRGTKAALIERILAVPVEDDEAEAEPEASPEPEAAPVEPGPVPDVSSRGRSPAVSGGVDEAPTTGAYVPNADEYAAIKARARAESEAALRERG